MTRKYDIQVSEDFNFQRRSWRLERVGWLVMAIIVIMAFLGLLGSGLLSETTLHSSDNRFQITFERIARGTAPAQLKATLTPPSDTPGEATLWIDQRIAGTMLIQHITPEPTSVSVSDGGYLYTFTAQAPRQPVSVIFHFTIHERGLITGRIGTSSANNILVRQFVLP